MTVIFECDSKWAGFGRFSSRVMTRYWFGWAAVSFLHIPLKELAEREFIWRS